MPIWLEDKGTDRSYFQNVTSNASHYWSLLVAFPTKDVVVSPYVNIMLFIDTPFFLGMSLIKSLVKFSMPLFPITCCKIIYIRWVFAKIKSLHFSIWNTHLTLAHSATVAASICDIYIVATCTTRLKSSSLCFFFITVDIRTDGKWMVLYR